VAAIPPVFDRCDFGVRVSFEPRLMRRRMAIVVSHPIQYYAPLYQRLARRDDLTIKVFFTWHAGQGAVDDPGFGRETETEAEFLDGYAYELVPNVAPDPGTHHFFGLINPKLVRTILAWRPDIVHVTGWASPSQLWAMRAFRDSRIKTLFRGDSHLLDQAPSKLHRFAKRRLLRTIYAWPSAFLYVGSANRAYYECFGVEAERLFPCIHSIDVDRFANDCDLYERAASAWRRELNIAPDQCVALFAGKFEPRKCPVELMRSVLELDAPSMVLVMVGGGELEAEIGSIAKAHPRRIRVLPYQSQKRMPLVYRLGDLCVLPSKFGETWGLAVNEALACGRPVLVSDRVGAAADLVDDSCGAVFSWSQASALKQALCKLTSDRPRLSRMRPAAKTRARQFDVGRTEAELMTCVDKVCPV
jgi:glycosyltransferase involved in cell wall biosynthesis